MREKEAGRQHEFFLVATFFYLAVYGKITSHASVRPQDIQLKEIFYGLRSYGQNPRDAK